MIKPIKVAIPHTSQKLALTPNAAKMSQTIAAGMSASSATTAATTANTQTNTDSTIRNLMFIYLLLPCPQLLRRAFVFRAQGT